MTIDHPFPTPWTLDEFVEQLNEHVPLDGTQDARRASAWNPRLVRHYTTTKALSAPEKQGRHAFYGPQHLDEARRLTSLQNAGVSAKSVAMLASSQETPLTESAQDTRQRALNLLNGWQNAIAPSIGSEGPAVFVNGEPSWSASVADSLGLLSATPHNHQAQRGVPQPKGTASTAALGAPRGEQWHRWSPVPGLDIALRDDLWDREDDLRRLLNTWANAR